MPQKKKKGEIKKKTLMETKNQIRGMKVLLENLNLSTRKLHINIKQMQYDFSIYVFPNLMLGFGHLNVVSLKGSHRSQKN